ncbi:MAG: hypothetical protein MZU91_05475 [Desulfosudis oleivorans]|nr:hypothetical protein [Desulfosudis oleivorans]
MMADASTCALPNQNTPNGYYNIERMLKLLMQRVDKLKFAVLAPMQGGLKISLLIEGAQISTNG